jgi:hypothetical protein
VKRRWVEKGKKEKEERYEMSRVEKKREEAR